MKSIDIKLLELIWQVLSGHIGNEVMQKSAQDIIKSIETNGNIGQDLIFVLYSSFYEAQNIIASKCREELIKKSIMNSYRGVITYKPPENDYAIKNLEYKIESLALQLKEVRKIKLSNQKTSSLHNIKELLTRLSQFDRRSLEETEDYLYELIEKAEKNCDVNIYKTTLREKENSLSKALCDIFLAEIEGQDELNSIFDANLFASKFEANLLTFKDVNDMGANDSGHHFLEKLDSGHHFLEKLDKKLLTITTESNSVKSGISLEEPGNQGKVAHDVPDNESQIKASEELKPNLAPEKLERALEAACKIDSELWRATEIGELAPHLSPEQLEQALEAVHDIGSGLWRAKALGQLAPYLSPEQLERAFYVARNIDPELWRARALGELAPHLPRELLKQAVEAARGIQSNYSRGRALEELTAHLSQ